MTTPAPTRNPLSAEESARLAALEPIVARKPGPVAKPIDVERLRADHASRAYKVFGTFADYARKVHGISRFVAYRALAGGRSRKQPIGESLRWKIWERDDFRCHYCGSRRFLTVDHVTPESAGGTLDESNLVTACRRCNLSKGANNPDSWAIRRALSIWRQVFHGTNNHP